MRLIKIAILLVFVFSLNLAAQTNPVIAKTGNRIISAKEFKLRYELAPQLINKKEKDEQTIKEDFLYSIIAEKLWAQAAEEEGMDFTGIMQKTFKQVEKMYVRDALYQKEIKDKTTPTEKDLRKALDRFDKILSTKYLVSFNKSEIDSLYNSLRHGANFDSLLSKRQEREIQNDYTTFTFGETDEQTEDILFTLNPGEFTKPLQKANGYFIFKLFKKEKKNYSNEKERKKDLTKARSVLEQRLLDKAEKEFHRKFFHGKKVSTDGYVFWSISNALIKVLNEHKTKLNILEGKKISLESKDFYEFEKNIGSDTLKMNFINIENNKISAEDFLYALMFEGFYTNTTDPDIIRAKLRARVKRFIEHELLAMEAFKRGYDKLPDVKMNIDIWHDNYLANLYKIQMLNSVQVTEEDAYNKFNENIGNKSSIKYVNIIEVLTDSLEQVNFVLNELTKGKSLRELAMKYTKREWVKKNNGEFGFFPVTSYGEIGRIAGTLNIGDIYGPLKTPDGYSIFKLIAVKEDSIKHKDFENVKEELVRKLKAEKIRNKLIKQTVELANKFGVSVDEDKLKSLKLNNLQMLVYKYFGFGGRMLAVPITGKFTDWVKPWKNKTVLP